jgi:hypothetical protein
MRDAEMVLLVGHNTSSQFDWFPLREQVTIRSL